MSVDHMIGKVREHASGDLRGAAVGALARAVQHQERDPEVAEACRSEALVYALLRIGDALEGEGER